MPSLVFPSLVRDEVLKQHVELRGLLERVIADAAPQSCAPGELDAEGLATKARDLCARFRTHLAFEEDALARVFAVLDAWGPERVRNLHDDHARQRREFDALLGMFESGGDVELLSVALRNLASDLLRDMEEEEDRLGASPMSDDSLSVERR
jgi:hypothetical protein